MKNYNEFMWDKSIFTDEDYKNFITNIEVDSSDIVVHLGDSSIKRVPYSKTEYDKYINIMRMQAKKGKKLLPKIKMCKMRLITFAFSLIILMGFSITRCVTADANTIKFVIDLISSVLFGSIGVTLLTSAIRISNTICDIEKNSIFLNIEDDLEERFSYSDSSIFLGLSRESKDIILESNPVHVGFDNLESLPLEDLIRLRENLKKITKEESSSDYVKKHILMPISKENN